MEDRRYARFSYYLPRAAGTGTLAEDEVAAEVVRPGGSEITNQQERLPAAELLVATDIAQSDVVMAIWTLTGRESLTRLHQARRVDAERFPLADYDRLSAEQVREVHALIRKLAGTTKK